MSDDAEAEETELDPGRIEPQLAARRRADPERHEIWLLLRKPKRTAAENKRIADWRKDRFDERTAQRLKGEEQRAKAREERRALRAKLLAEEAEENAHKRRGRETIDLMGES